MVRISSIVRAAALRAVIIGAPGSGKGTVSSRIVKDFGVSHISTGDKLRDHVTRATDLGKQASKFMNEGSLVPDELIIDLVAHEINAVNGANYLLDGFPRTIEQAKKLQDKFPVNLVLNLIVPHEVIIERVRNRWVHLPSGRVYNIGFNDPKVQGKDDVTGEPLSQRIDDRPEVVAKRLKNYSLQTEPVINYYKTLGIVEDFKGNTTNEIWPKIKKHVAEFIAAN
ncbi:GTP:AMP phosphotransferase AK3, mitochondrial [Microplitis demolitor]|uniref:GTP:AMP phosphotransferase AK3, mitochondrial n=1 Tax=Microplitis demolitor TaxID=69319 RepID=UPI0004CCFE65|nr:GTP:AMP phosphotransferase AK3, mitochondrial [Microplitis demolitor]